MKLIIAAASVAAANAYVTDKNGANPCASANGLDSECTHEDDGETKTGCYVKWLEDHHADADAAWDAHAECEIGRQEMMGMKYNHIVKMTYSQMTTSHSARTIFKKLQNYGCHCFPGQTREAGGSGPAVDAQDSLCKSLARCHKCVAMEFPGIIDVDHDKYRWGLSGGTISCEKSDSKHPSKRALCECDKDFALKMAALWKDDEFNNYYWHYPRMTKKPDHKQQWTVFDMDATCISGGHEGGHADTCCGESFPEKYPYSSTNKACCDNKTLYNPITNTCCPGGVVAAHGDC